MPAVNWIEQATLAIWRLRKGTETFSGAGKLARSWIEDHNKAERLEGTRGMEVIFLSSDGWPGRLCTKTGQERLCKTLQRRSSDLEAP